MIIVNPDVMLAKGNEIHRELADKIGITITIPLHPQNRQDQSHPLHHPLKPSAKNDCQPGDILEYRPDGIGHVFKKYIGDLPYRHKKSTPRECFFIYV